MNGNPYFKSMLTFQIFIFFLSIIKFRISIEVLIVSSANLFNIVFLGDLIKYAET